MLSCAYAVHPTINADSNAFALVVVSIFPNIPEDKGADACCTASERVRQDLPTVHPVTSDILRELLTFVLQHTWFTFDGKAFSILGGTAMGHQHSVPYANIFMSVLLALYRLSHSEHLA